MFDASTIAYLINHETKTITALATDLEYDAIEILMKDFRKQNLNLNPYDVLVHIPCGCDEDGNANPGMINANEIELHYHQTVNCRKYLLPDTMTATAKYDPNDPNPFTEERGKEIARRRLYHKYNRALHDALGNIQIAMEEAYENITSTRELARDRMMNFSYYEYYDIFKKTNETSEKL